MLVSDGHSERSPDSHHDHNAKDEQHLRREVVVGHKPNQDGYQAERGGEQRRSHSGPDGHPH